MSINKYLFVFMLSTLITGCGAPAIYLAPEAENLPMSKVALLYRDGIDGGQLVSVDGIKIPYNVWAPSPVYIKEGDHNVEYIKWDYFGTRTKVDCQPGSDCKYTTEKIRTTRVKGKLEKCLIKVEGGKTYQFLEVGKLLRDSGCETNVGYPY